VALKTANLTSPRHSCTDTVALRDGFSRFPFTPPVHSSCSFGPASVSYPLSVKLVGKPRYNLSTYGLDKIVFLKAFSLEISIKEFVTSQVTPAYQKNNNMYIQTHGTCGSAVVKALRYKSMGPGIDPR
jgi:hypothetical protein